jgi:hypothetical protein
VRLFQQNRHRGEDAARHIRTEMARISQKWEAENRGAAMRPPVMIAGTIPSQ